MRRRHAGNGNAEHRPKITARAVRIWSWRRRLRRRNSWNRNTEQRLLVARGQGIYRGIRSLRLRRCAQARCGHSDHGAHRARILRRLRGLCRLRRRRIILRRRQTDRRNSDHCSERTLRRRRRRIRDGRSCDDRRGRSALTAESDVVGDRAATLCAHPRHRSRSIPEASRM